MAEPGTTNGGTTDRDGVPAVSLRGLTKHYGTVRAVDGIHLDIAPGEFFAMLGPSGSGKTTTLRLIAGFDAPTSGSVHLGGTDVTALAPFDRDVNTVFQDYALFPHLDVQRNVEYGLRVKGVGARERRTRAKAALASVQLDGLATRRPHQLSGGQRQRVALARALVNRPRVLLLDEPLGALDLKLREEMQVELKRIQREAGITFVLVTHDQQEALSMSDRVAVFAHGRIEQVATPETLYDAPTSEFVATFVGTSNVLRGAAAERLLDRSTTCTVRPEHVHLTAPAPDTPPRRLATLTGREFLGAQHRVHVRFDDGTPLTAALPHGSPAAAWVAGLAPGASVCVKVDAAHAVAVRDTAAADRDSGSD